MVPIVDSVTDAEVNFRRLENVFTQIPDVDGDIAGVTGSLVVQTKLARVDRVVAGFDVGVIAGACFVVAFAGPNANEITITVWSNAFVPSVVVADISWIAMGELKLS